MTGLKNDWRVFYPIETALTISGNVHDKVSSNNSSKITICH